MGRTPKTKKKKLVLGEDVEVRQHDEGLRGSWYAGVVVEVKNLCRCVEYKELLAEDGKEKLIERIRVTNAVEGLEKRNNKKYRGSIRPLPPVPSFEENQKWHWAYGLCVDTFYEEAWWEGILLDDLEECEERSVFFPDEGDEHRIHRSNLRLTQDWDETDGSWIVRGHWVLATATMREYFERAGLCIKVVWYYLRQKAGLMKKVGEWAVSASASDGEENQDLWLDFLKEVVEELVARPSKQFLSFVNTSLKLADCNYSINPQGQESFNLHSGACELKELNKPEAEEVCRETLTLDSNSGGIVCCETSNSIAVAPDTAISLHLMKPIDMDCSTCNKSWEFQAQGPPESASVTKELCDANASYTDMGVQAGNNLSKVPNKVSDLTLLAESQEASWAEVNEQAYSFSAGRESCNNAGSKEQINWSDRVLLKDLIIMANSREQTECVDAVFSNAVPDGAGSKDKSGCIEKLLSKSASFEIDSQDQTSGLKDQISSSNNIESSHKISDKGDSLTLSISVKPILKHNSGCRSTPAPKWEPPANEVTFDSEYCPPAVLNYNLTLDKDSQREARTQAKKHLLAVGWRFEFKHRLGKRKRCDIRYVSPTGHNYYSLFQACLAWKHEQKIQRLIDGRHEDNAEAENSRKYILEGVSTPLPLQKTGVRVTRDILLSTAKFRKRSQRICGSSDVATHKSNNDNTAQKGSNEWVGKSESLRLPGNKKRNVRGEVLHVSESTHKTKAPDFQLECFYPDIVIRHTSSEGTNSKKYGQDPVPFSASRSKNHKLNSNDSPGDQKRKKAKRCRLLLKRKGKPANGYRMQALLSTPGKLKDSCSGQDKGTIRSVLSWMIENGTVDENQRVFYWNRKDKLSQAEGWITHEGILCVCCRKVYSLSNFEAHAGSKLHRPSANIILEDGRSLLQCQMQALDKNNRSKECRARSRGRRKRKAQFLSDDLCKICHDCGNLILCDHCPNSFHLECINMEFVPKGKWYCPNCRCVLCGHSEFNGDPECFTELTVLFCDQCECQYHVGCLYDRGMPKLDSCPEGNWFCSEKCSVIFSNLRNLVGMVNPVGDDGLSWTLLRSTEADGETSDQSSIEVMADHESKLFVALSVMHECFTPIIEARTKKDLVAELIFNRGCDRNWLNFRGFYTMILERGDELISVATVRIHGQRVAEMPLIGTRVEYRRKGMCRLLVKELEKLLHSLGVERLILPAISELRQAWQNAFGFQEMTSAERFELLELSFVTFPDTTLLQRLLTSVGREQEVVAETTASKNGVEAMHHSLGRKHGGLGILEAIIPKNVEISTSNIVSSFTEVAETVTPIRSLPCDICTYPVSQCNAGGEGCFGDSMKVSLLKRHRHIGSTIALRKKHRLEKNTVNEDVGQNKSIPVEDDLYLSKVVVATTRSNRLVRQVKWKVAYGQQVVQSEEREINHRGTVRRKRRSERKIYKRRKEATVIDVKYHGIPCTDSVESSQHKDIQFGTCEIRNPDEEMSITCSTSSTTSEGNCLSNLKASAPVSDGPPVLKEGGLNHVAANKENVDGNSHTLSCTELYSYRENDYGHLSCLKSFKYFYRRRRKQGNDLSKEIPSGGSQPVRSSISHPHSSLKWI